MDETGDMHCGLESQQRSLDSRVLENWLLVCSGVRILSKEATTLIISSFLL